MSPGRSVIDDAAIIVSQGIIKEALPPASSMPIRIWSWPIFETNARWAKGLSSG